MKLSKKQREALEKFISCSDVRKLKSDLTVLILTLSAQGDKSSAPINKDAIEGFAFLYLLLEELELSVG